MMPAASLTFAPSMSASGWDLRAKTDEVNKMFTDMVFIAAVHWF